VKFFGFGLDIFQSSPPADSHITPYIVMEKCDKSLNDIIYNPMFYQGPVSFPEGSKLYQSALERMCKFAMQVASGLAILHECGIVHRDIKAANVLVSINVQLL
jgi:serine/threonine protein kinase